MDVQNGSLNDQHSSSKESVVGIFYLSISPFEYFVINCSDVFTQCATPIDDANIIAQAKEDSENFKKRLRKDLMNRDGHR